MPESAISDLTEEIHRLLLPLIQRIQQHEQACAERFEVSLLEGKALYRLEPGETISVKTLAQRGLVDPSNLARPLKSLEDRGLVERRPSASDGRVRGVRLTTAGIAFRKQLISCHARGYPAVAPLSASERQRLYDLLSKIDASASSRA